MTINIEYETDIKLDIDYENIIKNVVNQATDCEKCPYEAEVNVTLTDNKAIHAINKEFRDVDRPTDVLSFPMIEYSSPADFDAIADELENNVEEYFNPDTGELMLGDIVVSVEKVMEQACSYNHSLTRELAFLVAHSMMHLFGYDHMEQEEAMIMEEKQEKVLSLLGISRDAIKNNQCVADDKADCPRLINKAKEALINAYAPYSGFKVGAAVLTGSGKIYTGCNIENASFGATNCAERTAIFKAVSEGERSITAVAIVSEGGAPTFPCGVCRQVMTEFMSPDAPVYVEDSGIKLYKLSELIPHSFNNLSLD